MASLADLTIICNHCGNPMRQMGEWPVQYPRDDAPKNFTQAFRYTCKTCKIPTENFPKGYEVGIAIIDQEVA